MKHLIILPGVLAILLGSLVLLPLLAWATLQDPHLTGANYCAAVLCRLFCTKAITATISGLVVLLLGIAVLLYSAFLAATDRHERKAALPMYWAALGVSSVAMVVLLVAVNFLGQQSSLFPVVSRWFGD
jgi:hypothetical protein